MRRDYDRQVRQKSESIESLAEHAYHVQRHRDVQHELEVSMDNLLQERTRMAAEWRKKRKLFDFAPNDDGYVDLGFMERACAHCSAKRFFDESVVSAEEIRLYKRFNFGNIMFPPLKQPLLLLNALLTATSFMQRKFRKNIISYNNILGMTSFQAKWDYHAPGLSTFHVSVTVLDQLFYLISPAQTLQELPPSFMSIYFDPSYAEQTKMRLI